MGRGNSTESLGRRENVSVAEAPPYTHTRLTGTQVSESSLNLHHQSRARRLVELLDTESQHWTDQDSAALQSKLPASGSDRCSLERSDSAVLEGCLLVAERAAWNVRGGGPQAQVLHRSVYVELICEVLPARHARLLSHSSWYVTSQPGLNMCVLGRFVCWCRRRPFCTVLCTQ